VAFFRVFVVVRSALVQETEAKLASKGSGTLKRVQYNEQNADKLTPSDPNGPYSQSKDRPTKGDSGKIRRGSRLA
jgi:hypothetical protein